MFALMGRKVDPGTVIEWARYLANQNLSNEAIGIACGKAVQDPEVDPYKFTIAKLLAYVKPVNIDPKGLALEEWGKVVSYISRGKARHGIPEEWGERTAKATTSIGGLSVIGDCEEAKLSYLRHAFINAYSDYSAIYENKEKQNLIEGTSKGLISSTVEKLCEGVYAHRE